MGREFFRCRYREDGFRCRVSARLPSNFSLFGQRKVTKRKATRHSALILRFSLLARVFGRAIHGPPKTSGIPAAPLPGYARQKLRCSGRNNGKKPLPKSSEKSKNGWATLFFLPTVNCIHLMPRGHKIVPTLPYFTYNVRRIS